PFHWNQQLMGLVFSCRITRLPHTSIHRPSTHTTTHINSNFTMATPTYDHATLGITDPTYQIPPGYLGNLTPAQESAFAQAKKELQEEGWLVEGPIRMTDSELCRFLRARQFNVAKTKEMFISCEKWRKEFGVDDLVANFEYPELAEVDKYYPQYYHKTDIDGRPVYIERLGLIDLTAIYKVTTQERQLQHLVTEYEKSINQRLPACSAAAGHPVQNFCTILDLKDASLSNFYRVKDYVFKAADFGQNRYPETLGKFYIINAPWLFSGVWSVIKPWLDEVTVSKIEILGSTYQDKLLEQIPAENLPAMFGGKCSCPGGCSLADAGPWSEAGKTAQPEEVTGAVPGAAPGVVTEPVVETEAAGEVLSA
ncbi:unnamed protein product, partial [Mycena citricolor]